MCECLSTGPYPESFITRGRRPLQFAGLAHLGHGPYWRQPCGFDKNGGGCAACIRLRCRHGPFEEHTICILNTRVQASPRSIVLCLASLNPLGCKVGRQTELSNITEGISVFIVCQCLEAQSKSESPARRTVSCCALMPYMVRAGYHILILEARL